MASTKVSKREAKHGLAPTGMSIPLQNKAFRVGGSDCAKCPLKESNEEKYNRIKAEEEGRKKKQNISLWPDGLARELSPNSPFPSPYYLLWLAQ